MKNSLFFTLFSCCIGFSQQTVHADFLRVEAMVRPEIHKKMIKGEATYTFRVLQKTDSIYLDAVAMRISEVKEKNISVTASEKKIWLVSSFQPGKEYTVSFSYEATPSQALYFTGNQIWTQGQGKYTSHWLPSLDDMNDKMEFDLQLITDASQTAVANGKLVSMKAQGEKRIWKFDMQAPMASYLAAFVVGDFNKETVTSSSGIPIELYYKPEDKSKAEPTYRYTKAIFDFLESEIGIPYPWQNYKQVPVRDFLYAGMENTTLTIFSEAFVIDTTAFTDRNYVNVNAHEMAHHWFGNLVTETEGAHHWLQEGFATYYALLAERELFGEDYYYWKLFNSAEQLKELSDNGNGESLLNPNAGSLTFYEKGAWALHVLKELVGASGFKSAVQRYLQKNAFANVTTADFLAEVKAVSAVDISGWEADWLQQAAFKSEQAYKSLMKSPFIQEYFKVAMLRSIPLEEKAPQLLDALSPSSDIMGQEVISQLADEPLAQALPVYKSGFETGNVYIRQAIAATLSKIPQELQTQYESLLDDASYATKEIALYHLWMNFPERRAYYLEQTAFLEGFQNKNIRQLWLALAIASEVYSMDRKSEFIAELISYTSPDFSFEIRLKAFEYLRELQLFDETGLRNLVNASVHHTWQFRNFARELLSELLKAPEIRKTIMNKLETFSEKEKEYVLRIMGI